MPVLRNFEEARHALRPFYEAYKTMATGSIYTLDRIKAVLARLGDPQDTMKVVHVAGTSGKTSTAYYAAALLQEAGAKLVGLSVSPAIAEMNERVQCNLVPLDEATYCAELGAFMDTVAAMGIPLTYFELKVAFAFYAFAKRKVEYAVMEVGMGGLLDGTNVVTRSDKVCIITDIGFDHTAVLGNTLPQIAAQKAGIVQPHNDVFMYEQGTAVMRAVAERCAHTSATLHRVPPANGMALDRCKLPPYQHRNLCLASEAVSFLAQRDGLRAVTPEVLRAAAATFIPGRMEQHNVGGKVVIFDGAHNGQKMTAFTTSLRAIYPDKPAAALVAFSRAGAERWQPTLGVLAAAAEYIIVTSFDLTPDDRLKVSLPAEDIAAQLRRIGYGSFTVEPDLAAACRLLLQRPEPVLAVTGSLYMLHDAQLAFHLGK